MDYMNKTKLLQKLSQMPEEVYIYPGCEQRIEQDIELIFITHNFNNKLPYSNNSSHSLPRLLPV